MDDLLYTAPCGFVSFGDDGTILLSNATLASMLGYGPGELRGVRIEQLLGAGGRLFYQTYLGPLLLLHGKVEEVALNLRTRSGEELPALLSGARRERDGV